MMIGVLFGNFCSSSCFIKISVSFYVKITFFPDFFDDLTPVAMQITAPARQVVSKEEIELQGTFTFPK